MPFLFLHFREHGMDAGQYGEIVGAYYLAMFLAEVPTGVMADRLGRKPMLVLGPTLLAGGFLLLWWWPTYAGFIAGEVLLGLGHAVLSGPPSALLYELLQRAGVPQRFLREESRLAAFRLCGTGTAFLLGGALAHTTTPDHDGYGATILATASLCAIAALVALRLAGSPPRPQLRLHAFLGQVTREVRRPAVLWLLGYWLVLFALLRFPFHNYQPYLRAAGDVVPLLHEPLFVGALFAVLNFGAAPLSAKVPSLVERWGRRSLFWGMPVVLALSLLVMAWERHAADIGTVTVAMTWLGIAMFFVQQVPFGMHWALLQEFVNHRIGNATRTTVLSVLSLGARSVYAFVNVGLFHLQEDGGMAAALAAAGCGGLLATVVVMWLRPRGLLRGQGQLDDAPDRPG